MAGKSELIRDGSATAQLRWLVIPHGWGPGWLVVDQRDQHEEKFESKDEALEYIRQIQGHRVLHRINPDGP
jgi:hypothetical protein